MVLRLLSKSLPYFSFISNIDFKSPKPLFIEFDININSSSSGCFFIAPARSFVSPSKQRRTASLKLLIQILLKKHIQKQ